MGKECGVNPSEGKQATIQIGMKKKYFQPRMFFLKYGEGEDKKCALNCSDEELRAYVQHLKDVDDQQVYQGSKDVVERQVMEEWVLVPVGSLAEQGHSMITLNGTGYFIWKQLREPHSLSEVLEAVHQHYDDPYHVMDMDVRTTVHDLAAMGLLIEVEP